jgi:hypothetical protein
MISVRTEWSTLRWELDLREAVQFSINMQKLIQMGLGYLIILESR